MLHVHGQRLSGGSDYFRTVTYQALSPGTIERALGIVKQKMKTTAKTQRTQSNTEEKRGGD